MHAIFELRIRVLEAEAEILEVEEIENLADDVGHGEVLKNSAVRLPGQEPEPRHHLGAVVGEVACVGFALRESADKPADVARTAVGKTKSNRNLLSNDILKRNGVILESKQV